MIGISGGSVVNEHSGHNVGEGLRCGEFFGRGADLTGRGGEIVEHKWNVDGVHRARAGSVAMPIHLINPCVRLTDRIAGAALSLKYLAGPRTKRRSGSDYNVDGRFIRIDSTIFGDYFFSRVGPKINGDRIAQRRGCILPCERAGLWNG